MTTPEIALLITAATALVVAIGGQTVNIIIALKTAGKVDDNTEVTKKTQERVIAVAEKAAVIEGHVNSAAAAYQEKIRSLQEQNALLQTMIGEQQETTRAIEKHNGHSE